MIKRFCDACGNEIITSNSSTVFTYLVHIEDMIACRLPSGYVDSTGDIVCGRLVHWEVCNRCYNKVMVPSVEKFHEMRDQAVKDDKIT